MVQYSRTTDACVFVKNIVYPQLKDDINRSMQGLIDVKEFVKAVWGFDEADLQWDKWTFEPPAKLQDEFKLPDEKARYKPFCDMLDNAFEQWRKVLGVTRKRTVQLVPNPDKKRLRGYTGWWGEKNQRNPDVFGEAMAGLAEHEISTVAGLVTWHGMPIVGEFKKWLIAQLKPKLKPPVSAPELPTQAIASSIGAKRRLEVLPAAAPLPARTLFQRLLDLVEEFEHVCILHQALRERERAAVLHEWRGRL
ncbi:hypothetical protein EWM64_g8441 [Hericium alpestre]|uniref:Uncharacterized protein n=1 Tax=Hericium alpestre TaxID=135208 RepID=A0A4Y9ZLC3_9AGAM|nr:hypothetical protein EWM64_g8441 [Hericium alpestre]